MRIAICPGWHLPVYERKRIRPDNASVLKARLHPTLADAGASGGATARCPWMLTHGARDALRTSIAGTGEQLRVDDELAAGQWLMHALSLKRLVGSAPVT